MKSAVGLTFAILASICFGFLGIFAKVGYDAGSNPTTVLVARFLLAAIILFIVIKISGKSLKITKEQLGILFIMGAIGYTLTTQTLFESYEYVGVGLATGLHFIYPLCVCIFGFLFVKEKFTKRKTIALVISIIGVFLLSASEKGGVDIRGIFLALLSGIVYGATVFGMGREKIKMLNGMVTTFYCSLFAGIITLIIGAIRGQLITKINVHIGVSYLGIAVVSTVISLVFLQIAIKDIGASNSSILGTFEPIVGIIASFIFFGESIGVDTILGMLLIVVAVIILSREKPEVLENTNLQFSST
ncbi:MAG: DMT family transporter [Clostridium sp.]|uniref:DMT family transporter n=1 Tax=Clostridium sp. TaxID=1506 RepID=UPI003F2DEE2D